MVQITAKPPQKKGFVAMKGAAVVLVLVNLVAVCYLGYNRWAPQSKHNSSSQSASVTSSASTLTTRDNSNNAAAVTTNTSPVHQLLNFHGESVRLRSGTLMPAIGYGTCCRSTAHGKAIQESTLVYLQQGGRLIDTAMAYANQMEIGRAILDSHIPRREIWVTSKISPNKLVSYKNRNMDPDQIAASTLDVVKDTIQELIFKGDDAYIDLMLIHTPKLGSEATIGIWKGLIQAKQENLVKVLGVSNFNQPEILDLFKATNVFPEVNQIQFHPWTSPEWKAFVKLQHSELKIVTTAYNSLGGSRFHKQPANEKWPSYLSQLATKYSATPAQVLLRWALQQPGIAVIPGSASPEHIRENLMINMQEPTFTLTQQECDQLESMPAPVGWWDAQRGPVKYNPQDATDHAWEGDHGV